MKLITDKTMVLQVITSSESAAAAATTDTDTNTDTTTTAAAFTNTLRSDLL